VIHGPIVKVYIYNCMDSVSLFYQCFLKWYKINMWHYATQILAQLLKWCSTQMHVIDRKLLMQIDNMNFYIPQILMNFFWNTEMKMISLLLYFFDLVLLYFYLFGYVNRYLIGIFFIDIYKFLETIYMILNEINKKIF
jgi:hypothetical protein